MPTNSRVSDRVEDKETHKRGRVRAVRDETAGDEPSLARGGRARSALCQKKPRRSGASKWEERRPKRDDHSLAESSKCVPIEVAFIPSVRRQMCIANYWAISAVLKHFDENWIGGYKKGVCPFLHQG